MSVNNPYQPPRSDVADVSAAAPRGDFLEGGRAVEAGQGWAWIVSGFALFRKRPGAWVLVTVVAGVLAIVVSILPFVGWLINTLLMPVYLGGLLLGCQALEEDRDFGVAHLFAGFRGRTGGLMVLGALSLAGWVVIMLAMFLVTGASLMGAMSGDPAAIAAAGPGLALGMLIALGLSVPLYMALWFAPCLVVFNEVQPVPALKQSFGACLRNIVPFLLYGLVLMVLFILAAIPFGLGFLVAIPVLVGSVYAAYRDVFYAPTR